MFLPSVGVMSSKAVGHAPYSQAPSGLPDAHVWFRSPHTEVGNTHEA